jgi:hypothetical protein
MRFSQQERTEGSRAFRTVIIVLAIGGALALIAFVGTRFLGAQAERRDRPEAKSLDLPPERDPKAPAYRAPGEPESKKLPEYLFTPETLKDAVDSQVLDSYPFYYLLYQAKVTPPAKFREQAVPAAGPEQMKRLSPGQPVELEGDILSITPRDDLRIPDADITDVMMYEIVDARHNVFLVLAVHGMSGVLEGDRVKVLGRYLQQFPHVRTGTDRREAEESAAVIVARAVDGSHLVRNPDSLDRVQDYKPYFLAKPLYYVVDLVRRTPQATLKAEADTSITPAQMEQDPAAIRGKVVRVQGGVIQTQRRAEPPNIAGVDNLYRCVIRTNEGRWLWVYTPEEPKGFKRYDLVRAYGVFLKAQRYVSRKREERDAPVIIAKRLLRTRYQESPGLGYMLLIIAVATIVAIAIAVAVESRRRREVAQRVQALSSHTRPRNLDSQLRTIAARRRDEAREKLGVEVENAGRENEEEKTDL